VDTSAEYILVMPAALPAIYGRLCRIRRMLNARKAASRGQATHTIQWNRLHRPTESHHRAGVEVLIRRGWISGPEADTFRAGLLTSAVRLLVVVVIKFVFSGGRSRCFEQVLSRGRLLPFRGEGRDESSGHPRIRSVAPASLHPGACSWPGRLPAGTV
jgi:hypothetical protein